MDFEEFKKQIHNRVKDTDISIVELDEEGTILIENLIPAFFQAAYEILQEETSDIKKDSWGRNSDNFL